MIKVEIKTDTQILGATILKGKGKEIILTFPPRCACCLAATEQCTPISTGADPKGYCISSVLVGDSMLTPRVMIPMCLRCQGHRNVGCFLVGSVVALIFFIGLGIFRSNLEEGRTIKEWIIGPFGIVFYIFVLVLAIGSRLLRVYQNIFWLRRHSSHARASTPVKLKEERSTVILEFYNDNFGKMFVEVNRDWLTQIGSFKI